MGQSAVLRATILFLFLLAAPAALAQLPPPPVPAENPITESKRVLGKILFWDEQLSSDNTVACGSCHSPANATIGAAYAPELFWGGRASSTFVDTTQPDSGEGFFYVRSVIDALGDERGLGATSAGRARGLVAPVCP